VLVGALLVLVGIGWLLDAGGVEVPWRADSGFANRLDTTVEAGSDRRLELDLRVGIGQVRVER
jgi:hypothetical protein